MKNYTKFFALLCLALAVGCTEAVDSAENDGPSYNDSVETAGLALTTDVLADTDLGGVRFTVTEVDCATGDPIVPAHVESADVDLADMFIPGGNGTFEDAPYDADSQHLFADQYFNLSPGCYDVLVEPLQEDGRPSRDCWSAHRDAVPVFAGSTTEILLIMQCRGEDTGGLDVIATVNHPPQIDDLVFDPSKFTCEDSTRVCITVSDPDSDPVEVHWQVAAGAQIVDTSIETNEEGETVACATIYSSEPGTYQAAATVFDLGYDANGNLIPIEKLLEIQGDPHPSRATLKFPVHMLDDEACINTCDCPEGYEYNEVADHCERTEVTEVTVNGETFRVCAGDRHETYSAAGASYPGGDSEQNAFFGQSWSDDTEGRLNRIGVWTCDGDTDVTGSLPHQKWIGFATCIDAPAAGDYLIGMGADNRVRVRIDGTIVSPLNLRNGDTTNNFTTWWMIPTTLSAGAHTIELEGYNKSSKAAFGAEIYGPFPAGSLNSDAAMAAADVENNIIWSTGDMIGGTFLTGEDSGYSCPDGSSIDICAEKPVCTQTLIRKCTDEAPNPDGTIDSTISSGQQP